ncbi:hypothetical protein [Ottowia thiooxydans]|uniref:Uncharacterized protein n=1 Tax=Ottowia thiooxydans TaxID=219182 RepID=A0ABV2Q2T0_9BURK
MQLDTTRFPLVFLREHDHEQSHDEAEAQIAALLDRGERFVLLTDHLPGDDHRHNDSHEDRKQRALFFKRNKQRLKDLCAGLVIITGDRSIPAAAKLALQTLGKVLGLGFVIVRDTHDATEQASKLLGH